MKLAVANQQGVRCTRTASVIIKQVARCGAALALVASVAAEAATYRYAVSSNRIYVEGGGTTTLTEIKAALPAAPLELVDTNSKIWLLRANLIISQGSALRLHGGATGDVEVLRLQSNAPGNGGHIEVTADYGEIDIQQTKILSWNMAASAVDTNYEDGRAFVRVRSRLGPDGVTPLESRMNVIDSELAYLGYNAAESYGVVWKVTGGVPGEYELFDKVDVFGNIINSKLHHNYFGMYSYGHKDGIWRGNQVHNNVQYGFDPHDDSDNLLIENNEVHHNGNHGIIASQRCDNVTIRGNLSYANIGNGIMLHRSSNDSLIENNRSYDNSDSGIALFANSRTVVRGNTLLRNANAGIRVSMGGEDNLFENNIVKDGGYGLYFYRGSDTPEPGDDGRPRRNTFRNNQVHDNLEDAIKMTDGDNNSFIGNKFSGNGPEMRFTTSTNTRLSGNSIPSNVTIVIDGTSVVPTRVLVNNQPRLSFRIEDFGSALLSSKVRAIFDPTQSLFTTVSAGKSSLLLTAANTSGATTVVTRKLYATPSVGKVKVSPTLWDPAGEGIKQWQAQLTDTSASVTYVVGDLTPGQPYRVLQGAVLLETVTADAKGRVSFSAAPDSLAPISYSVRP